MAEEQWRKECVQTSNNLPKAFKEDTDKAMWSLLPYSSLRQVVEVLTVMNSKYGRDNWKRLEDGENRLFDAAMRHLVAFREGEQCDKETHKHHLAHAVADLLFILGRLENDA